MSARAENIERAVVAQATAAGGTLGLGTFLRTVLDELKAIALQQVDTEEERDAIKDKVLSLADTYVAPKFPVGWKLVRNSVDVFLDESMDNLPGLLAP